MRLFEMKLCPARVHFAQAGAALALVALIAGCGDNYRPVVTPIATSGPPAQPTSYLVAVSTTGASTPGVVTIIDYSGDSILTEAPIGPGPKVFTVDAVGATGYTVNSDGSLSNFAITTSLQAKNVSESTLPSTAQPVNLTTPTTGLLATDLNGDVVDVFSGSPQAFKLAIPVATSGSPATMPVLVVGSQSSGGQREYVLSQDVPDTTPLACNLSPTTAPTGVATPIETSSATTDPAIPVGKCPVYGVQTPSQQRLFVMNRGDDTISVINSRNNTPDACTPFQNQSGQWVTCHPAIQLPAGSGPIYAEYSSTTQQLVVANYDGGTISVVNVPLDEYGNDSNTYANPTCTVGGVTSYANCGAITGGFGMVTTINVGNTATPNPASVTVLADGSKAYTANQNDDSGTGNGTVTVVNLSTYTVEKTITVVGHPRTVVNTQNSEYSKIYVASPDSPFITIIESSPTVTDLVDTTVLVEGTIVDLRTTSQTAAGGGNNNYTSRVPGYGQPCNLSPAQLESYYGSNYLSTLTLLECQEQSLP
jgi:DNA-binding beta-propeller fold protein YncE